MRKLAYVLIALAMLLWPALLFSQEVNTRTPEHPSGVTVNAPIPSAMHQQNTGGSDGAGLCVIASVKTAGEYLAWSREVAELWEAAKRLPGGYYDSKFDALARRVAPNLKYAHYHGRDYSVLQRLSAEGLAFGVTMDTGEKLYGNRRIAHMVTGVHFDGDLAAYIDNNSPGMFTWVSRPEWERRSKLNTGEFWVLAMLPNEGWTPPGAPDATTAWLLAGLLVAGGVWFATRTDEQTFEPSAAREVD